MDGTETIDTPITNYSSVYGLTEFIKENKYRGMIGFLLYLTVRKLDIIFSVGHCVRF